MAKIITLPQLPSTNAYLKEQLAAGVALEEGIVIWAQNQTAGRGQMGTTWESKASESLTFSILLRPTFLDVSRQYYLSMAVALGVLDALRESVSGDVAIKWSNDLYLRRKKCAGILIENGLVGKQIQYSVVGIGINVNQREFSENLDRATSMSLATGQSFVLEDVLNLVLKKVFLRYEMLKKALYKDLYNDFLKNQLFYKQKTNFKKVSDGQIFSAVITDVNEWGHLVLTLESGKTESFGLKEIEFLF